MELSKKEREKLIAGISRASGVAQYALKAKMTDSEIIEAANNLKVLLLIKDANNYNRYVQAQKTAEANTKLKQFLDLKNSEIFQAGQWLVNTLSKKGQERRDKLKEKELVHKDDYNTALIDLKTTIQEQQQGTNHLKQEASKTIKELEKTIDTRKKQLSDIKSYIIHNYGKDEWEKIVKYFSLNISSLNAKKESIGNNNEDNTDEAS